MLLPAAPPPEETCAGPHIDSSKVFLLNCHSVCGSNLKVIYPLNVKSKKFHVASVPSRRNGLYPSIILTPQYIKVR